MINFDFLLSLSLFVARTLTIVVFCLAIGILLSKIIRLLWERYAKTREEICAPSILSAISDESGRAVDLFGNGRRWGDWIIVERELLKWSMRVTGFGYQRLCCIFDGTGFADYEIQRLKSLRWWIRAEAAQTLGQMSCRKAVDDLVKALEDKYLDVRLMSAWALGKMGEHEAIMPIVESLSHYSKLAALQTSDIMHSMGNQAVSILEKIIQAHDHDAQFQVFVMNLLISFKDKTCLKTALRFANSPHLELRIAVCRALSALGNEECLPVVLCLLRDPDWQVRSAAASAAGRLGLIGAIEALRKCLGDHEWWVRLNAGESLGRMGDKGKEALGESLQAADRFARDMAKQWLDELLHPV